MSTDKESNFPVEDFVGVDLQTDREKKSPTHFRKLKNLWEPQLGTLEPRRGSDLDFDVTQLPSNVTGIDRPYKLYRSVGENVRVLPVYCDDSTGFVAGSGTLAGVRVLPQNQIPAEFDFLFQNGSGAAYDGEGNWLSTNFGGGGLDDGTYEMSDSDCIFRLVGFGFDKLYELDISTITGYVTPAADIDKILRIRQNTDSSDSNVLGWELYQRVDSRFIFIAANDVWNDTSEVPSNLRTCFSFSPACRPIGSPVSIGSTEVPYSVEVIKNGAGNLKKGTYYVTVTSQDIDKGASPDRNNWSQTNQTLGDQVPIVVDEDNSAIVITVQGAPQKAQLMAWIGNHWQCLTPAKILWDEDGGGENWELTNLPSVTALTHYDLSQNGNKIWIKEMLWSPAAVLNPYMGSTAWRYDFVASDFSTKDMAIEILDETTYGQDWRGVFMSRVTHDAQVVDPPLYEPSNAPSFLDNRFEARFLAPGEDIHQQAGNQSRYDFAQTDDIMFAANDFDPNTITGLTSNDNLISFDFNTDVPHDKTNLMVSDGRVFARISTYLQSGGSDEVYLPAVKYVEIFEDSLVVAGGFRSTDPESGALRDGSRSVFYSTPTILFDFLQAGAPTNTLNQFNVKGPEEITGIGVYSNTSGDSGPITQLIVGKQNSSWLTTTLPFDTSATMTNLSQKAGIISRLSIVNTPVGTFFCSVDNVYLMRGTGEPTPVGNEISPVISRSDLTRAVAVYHDQQLKISFYDPEEDGSEGYNNVEWWLDIRKLKAQNGRSSWKGPMIGLSIDYSLTEDFAPDGISYDSARDRLIVDKRSLLVIKADVLNLDEDDVVYDNNVPVEWEIETSDFRITQQDNNWNKLITRFYLKAKTTAKRAIIEEETWTDGELREEKDIEIQTKTGNFSEEPLITRSFFPKTRIRGRTLRKVLRSTARVAIGGFALLYRIERRRI